MRIVNLIIFFNKSVDCCVLLQSKLSDINTGAY